jgi:UDP-N-acetylmuramoyl-L-alanyl-D-glutamate--2,6-diaminopimelate ligase
VKSLKDILFGVAIESVYGPTDISVNSIDFDSRKVNPDSLFVALKGTITDGHQYLEQVIDRGVRAILCEKLPETRSNTCTYVVVNDSKRALAILAANFYDNPSQDLTLVGVTGTNGKTTIATLLYDQFKKAGYKTGLLSTVKVLVHDQEYPATHTTPDLWTPTRAIQSPPLIQCGFASPSSISWSTNMMTSSASAGPKRIYA